jgi:hypothetical protein
VIIENNWRHAPFVPGETVPPPTIPDPIVQPRKEPQDAETE